MPKKSAGKSTGQLAVTVFGCGVQRAVSGVFEPLLADGSISSVESLAESVAQCPMRPVLVVSLSPVTSLALTLQRAKDAGQALAAWCNEAADLVAQHKRATKQVTVADAGLFVDANDATWDTLTARLGVDISAARGGIAALPAPNAAYQLAAAAFLERDETAKALASQLQSITIGATADTLDVATILAALKDMRDAEAMDPAAAPKQVELDGDDLHSAVSDYHRLKANNEALTRRLANVLHAAEQREEILGTVLLADTSDETQSLKDELARVYASRSWRVTAPLRSFSGKRGGGAS